MEKFGAILALALLAGCGGEPTRQIVPTYVHVKVVNDGTE